MRFSLIVLASFLLPALAAPTPDSGLVARTDYHCPSHQEWSHEKKCCVDKPKPVKCPETMIYNPKTMKCFQPANHPSEINCKYIGKVYNAHEKICEDVKKPMPPPPAPPAPVDKHCPKHQIYSEHEHKCVDKPVVVAPPVDKHCPKHQVYSEHEHKCVDKPVVPPQAPTCPEHQKYVEHKGCVNKCNEHEEYSYHEKICKPKVAPVPTCADYQSYSVHEKKCVNKCSEHLRYNPKTMKCYNPSKHPSYDNCKTIGKLFNAHEGICYNKPTCKKDEYYDESKKCCLPVHH